MELGGSDAFIVLDDADLDHTVAMAILGRFGNTRGRPSLHFWRTRCDRLEFGPVGGSKLSKLLYPERALGAPCPRRLVPGAPTLVGVVAPRNTMFRSFSCPFPVRG